MSPGPLVMLKILTVYPGLVSVDYALLLDEQVEHDLCVHRPLDDVLLVVPLPSMALHAFVSVATALTKYIRNKGISNLCIYPVVN